MKTSEFIKKKQSRLRFPVMKEIASRFSPRFFSDQPMPAGDLQSMIEAARFAPSARNHQPWYFYFVEKGSKSHQTLMSCIPFHNRWCPSAPVLIIACYLGAGKDWTYYDLGAAVMSLVLQAQHLGYYARQMGLFDKKKVKRTLPLDKDHTPFTLIAIGKIGDYEKINPLVLALEKYPRTRKANLVRKI